MVDEESKLEGYLLARRIDAVSNGSPLALFASFFSIILLHITFSDDVPALLLIGWTALAFLLFGVNFVIFHQLNLRRDDRREAKKHFDRLGMLTATSGVAWAAGFVMFAYYGSGLDLVILALISTAVFVGVLLMHRAAPLAGLVQTIAIGASLLLASWFVAGWGAWPVMVLIACYTAVLARAIITKNRDFVAAARSECESIENEATVRMLLDEYENQARDCLWTVDAQGRLREVSDQLAESFGLPAAKLEGMRLVELLSNGQTCDEIEQLLASRTAFRDLVVHLEVSGEPRYWSLSARPRSDGRITGVSRDVTEARTIEERVQYMAHFDNLTGLANRYMFNERLRETFAGDQSDVGRVALFCVDLDDFKAVNDTHSHIFGDRLLRKVGSRIEQEVGVTDLVARLGGDEFAIVTQTDLGDGMLIERAHRLLKVLREPFVLDGQRIILTCSVGVARADGEVREAAELMRRADLALFSAKSKGRDNVALFDHRLHRQMKDRRRMAQELRDAIRTEGLQVHYQPVIDLDTGATVAYEALVRWDHPKHGLLGPGEFLSIAEETGLIVPLGDWVLRRALTELAAWDGDFRIAINLSPTQIKSAHLHASVIEALAQSGIDPARLELEITEHVILEDNDAALSTLMKLRDLGICIALDDFGTGYSSLSYLRRFPFDRIKIDRQFVGDLETSELARAIVTTIIRLAEAMHIPTTAEGVERAEQLDQLRELGCDEAQGYLILEPSPASQFVTAENQDRTLADLGEGVLDYREARRAVLARRN